MPKVTKLGKRDGLFEIAEIKDLYGKDTFSLAEFMIELGELCAIRRAKVPSPIQVGLQLKKLGFEVTKQPVYSLAA